eukprot:GILI01001667.1.p1 GENE.GILI01001667.1~~GILI01001667.1.p1  ORF type:complete len:1297 (+),score=398.64 GILI01001667.1:125-4015(+)
MSAEHEPAFTPEIISHQIATHPLPTSEPADKRQDSTTAVEMTNNGTSQFDASLESPAEKLKREKEEAEHQPQVAFTEVFKFADRTDRVMMVLGAISAFIAGAGMPAFSEVLGRMINDLFSAQGTVQEKMSDTGAIMVYVGLATFFFSIWQVTFWMLSSARQVSRVRILFFESVMRQDIGWHDEHKPGELISRMDGDTRVFQNGINDKFSSGIYQFGMFLSGFGFGFFRSWELTLLLFGTMPIIAAVGAAMAGVMTQMTEMSREGYANAGAIATEVMENIRTVQAFGQEEHEVQRFLGAAKPSEEAGLKRELASNGSVGVTYFVMFCSYGIAFWFSSYLIEWGRSDVGSITACFFSVLFASFALGLIFPSFSAFSESRGSAHKLFNIIDRIPPINIEDRKEIAPALSTSIEFRNIEFAYPTRKDHKLFKDLNVTIQKGQTVAFSGVSGSGKSSIIQMIQRFYDPDGGSVLVDGKDMRDIDLYGWREQIGIVSQEPSLFAGTISDNVRVGKADATDDEVSEACRKANIHDVIMSLPEKYDTNIGTVGSQLSGGQKQRIAIARAIVKNPKILILDEATSALDRKSEVEVQTALDKVMNEGSSKLTVVVIAHRLATIRDADVIHFIVTDEVRGSTIAESGTFGELLALNGHFAAMTRRQNAESTAEEDDTSPTAESPSVFRAGETVVKIERAVSDATIAPEEIIERQKTSVEKEIENKEIPYLRILKMNRENLWAIALGMVGSLISGGVYPVYAVVFANILDVLGSNADDIDELRRRTPLWASLFFVVGVGSFIGWMMQTFYAYAGERLTTKLRTQLFRHILRQDQAFFDMPGRDAGAMAGVLAGDCEAVHQLWGPSIGFKVQMACNLSVGFAIAFAYSWKLTLVTLSAVPAIVIAGAVQQMLMVGFGHQSGVTNEDSVKAETFTNIRTVASFNLQQRRSAEYQKYLTKDHSKQVRNAIIMGIIYGFTQFVFFGVFALAYWYGGGLIDNGELNFKDVMICSTAVLMGAMGAGEAGGFASKVKDAEIASKRVFSILDRLPTIDPEVRGETPNGAGSIAINDVQFRYPSRPDAKILKKFSSSFPAGSTNGFMGSTGCGKSTVIQLLARFYEMNHGTITVDGHDITTLDLVEWRRNLSIVLQEPSLFSGTVRENIRYSKLGATDEEVEEAAKLACIHEDILTWPNGYETEVGYKGRALSGGQKQRVAIARGLIRKPKLLLLDEATSALDNATEARVQRGIERAHKQNPMTIVSVAHRLTTIQDCNKIIVMDAGVIIEEGSHEELMALHGEYRTRWELYQAGSK